MSNKPQCRSGLVELGNPVVRSAVRAGTRLHTECVQTKVQRCWSIRQRRLDALYIQRTTRRFRVLPFYVCFEDAGYGDSHGYQLTVSGVTLAVLIHRGP